MCPATGFVANLTVPESVLPGRRPADRPETSSPRLLLQVSPGRSCGRPERSERVRDAVRQGEPVGQAAVAQAPEELTGQPGQHHPGGRDEHEITLTWNPASAALQTHGTQTAKTVTITIS
jgi:hypothetical protein